MASIPLLDLGKPLQLPDPVRQAPVDFRPLNMIGDAVSDYRVKTATAEALAGATGPDGKVNFDAAGAKLGQMGLLDQARPFLDLAMRKTALEQSNAQHSQSLGVQREHNRAMEANAAEHTKLAREQYGLAREQYENPKPTVKESYNPATGQMEFYEVRPGGPVKNLSQPAAAPQPQAAAAPQPGATAPIVPTAVATQDVAAPAPAQAPPAIAPAAATAAPAPTQGTGYNDAALVGLSPSRQELVKKVARYEINPASLSTKGGEREFILGKASEYDKTYDQPFYSTKQRTLGAFSAGPEGRTLRAVNNLTDHLDTAEELVKALGNPNMGPQALNALRNKFAAQFGYVPPSNLAAAAPIIGGEITKVVAGVGAGGVSERAEAAAGILGQAKTEKQALEAIGVIKKLMGGQIHGLEQQYKSGTRLDNFRERLSPGARKIIEASEGTTTPKSEAAPAAPSKEAIDRARSNPVATYREAQDLIAKGANKDQIRSLLLGADLDPSKIGL